MRALAWTCVCLLAAACSSRGPEATADGGADAGTAANDSGATWDGGTDAGPSVDGGSGQDGGGLVAARPYSFHVPTGYDAGQAAPLLILLHGYGATGAIQEAYFKLIPLSDAQTFLYAYPDGTLDPSGHRFWNATDACCDLYGAAVDDVAYVNAIIDDVESRYNVDRKRVFVVGHSNGGFMAHRMGCEASARIAGIVSLAGAQWEQQSHCTPTNPVAVLEVHGTADTTILYDGGSIGTVAYPSAPQTVADWAAFDGCGALNTSAPNIDLDTGLLGAETTVDRYDGCDGGAVELWSIQGGGHIPALSAQWPADLYGFLSAHPKP